MATTLTSRQAGILAFIRQRIDAGSSPSLREIGARFRMKHTSVADHLDAMETKGAIQRIAGQRRNIRVLDSSSTERLHSLPLVGRIAAGSPILADGNVDDWLPISASIFRPAATFLLRVKGDSMIGVGIHDGDLVGIHAQETAQNGQVVAALIRNEATGEYEATLKRLKIKGDRLQLSAENPASTFGTLQIKAEDALRDDAPFRIAGVYCGHIHRGQSGSPH